MDGGNIAPKETPLTIYYDPETMRICDDGGEGNDEMAGRN